MPDYDEIMTPSGRLNIVYSHRTRGEDVEGIHIRGIANAFNQLGHNVSYVTVPGVKTDSVVKNIKKDFSRQSSFWTSVSKYCPQILFEVMELFYNILLYTNLIKLIKKQRIDFIYERYALNTFATVMFGNKYNIPVILEVNDATGIQRVRKHKAEFIAKRIESWIFNNCDSIVTISSTFEHILHNKGVPKEKISFVPNAVDPLVFDPNLYNDQVRAQLNLHGKVVIGFIGSFAKWHGVEMLLKVMPEIIKTIPEAHFLLVGSGACLQDIKNMVEKMGMIEYATFPGKVPPEDVPNYLKAMDVGVIPDSNQYGSPMKLFEYMAMEVVPVAPNLPPILDVIEDSVTGFVFEQDDEKSMMLQLIRACRNSELRKQIGKYSREEVLRRHLWSHNANHVLRVYSQIKRNSRSVEDC